MTNPSRGLIKSMLVTGSAQAIKIVISILRMKVFAIVLGPAGLGLLGIYNNLLQTATTLSGLGIQSSGVRQIAVSKGEETVLSQVRFVLFTANVIQGTIAMAIMWALRSQIAQLIFGDTNRASDVGLIGVAVLLSVLVSSQTALLQGLRRIGDLGRITITSTVLGSITGLLPVWFLGEKGLIWFLLIQPLTSIVIAFYYTRRLPKLKINKLSISEFWTIWRPMFTLGVVFMFGGLATTVTLLLVRTIITQEFGLEAAGLFAASWGITMTYVGFLLNAMTMDYFPRLTEVIKDRATAARLMNVQMQLGLALGGPFLLLLIGLAPWVMWLFYSPAFIAAADMLQWQTMGNIFKLAGWSLGFAHVAAARSGVFLLNQVYWNVIFVSIVWFFQPTWGLTAAGIAFFVAYLIGLFINAFLVRRLYDFRWESLSIWLVWVYAGLAFTLFALAKTAPLAGAGASVAVALVTGLTGIRIVLIKVGPEGRLATRIAGLFTAVGWPLNRNE